MTSSAREIVISAWKAFASREPELIASHFAEDAEWLAPAGNATALALGISHHMVGREVIVRFLVEQFPKLFVESVHVDFRGIHAAGDTVFVEERMTATLRDGGHYENEYCFAFEVSNGRILRVREYMDTARGARCVFPEPRGVSDR
jgi:ketosteroid isomerase-like protein